MAERDVDAEVGTKQGYRFAFRVRIQDLVPCHARTYKRLGRKRLTVVHLKKSGKISIRNAEL